MGARWIISLSLTFILAYPAWADSPNAPPDPGTHSHHDAVPIEHIELTLPKQLLPGLPALDQSLSMDEAVRLGLERNLGIQVAESDVGIRRALLRQAGAQRWPVLSVGSLTFLRTKDNQTLMTPDGMMTTTNKQFFEDLNATARVPLFTGGRILAGIRAARFGLEGSQEALRQTIVDTAYAIKQAYLSAQLSTEEHRVHQDHIAVQDRLLKNADARYRVGKGLRADVLRIQTEIADARRMLNEEHIQLNNALYDLKVAMGLDLGSEIEPAEKLSFSPWLGSDLSVLVQQASAHHPRFVEAQKSLQEAEAQLRVARAAYLPQVYGQVTGNLRIKDDPPTMGNGVIGLVTASLPVVDRNRGAEIARAQATVQRAGKSLQAIQLEVAKDVAKSWNELQFSKENVALADAAVTQAQEDLRLVQRRYEVGRAVVVEVQDAALQLRQAQLNRVQAVYNHELAKARLIQAIGEVAAP